MLHMNMDGVMFIGVEEEYESEVSIYVGHVFFLFPWGQSYAFIPKRPNETPQKLRDETHLASLGIAHVGITEDDGVSMGDAGCHEVAQAGGALDVASGVSSVSLSRAQRAEVVEGRLVNDH